MARGGSRTGTPGKSYQNRVDLTQPIKAVSGEAYGQRKAIEMAQRAIPLPNSGNQPPPAPPNAPVAPSATPPGPPALPGQQPFDRPTERPTEPVTAGIPDGPGPGPEALSSSVQTPPDLIGAQLHAIFAQFPNDDLLRVMALHQQGQ